jgi:hypothetical protein
MAAAMSAGHAVEHEIEHQAEDGTRRGADVFGEYGVGVTCASAVILLLAVATIDKLTGAELRLQAFYLIPVAMVTWVAGRIWGVLFSLGAIACSIMMFGAAHTYSAHLYFYWDAAVALGTLIAFVILLSRLRSALEAEEKRKPKPR